MANPFLLIVAFAFSMVTGDLEVRYEWKYIDYLWKNEFLKQSAIESGNYNASRVVTIDVDRAGDGRIFVTTPRIQQLGVPATLSTISHEIGDGGPLLKPYPNWNWHQAGNCDTITSVFRVAIDSCNRLWVLDTGKIGEEQTCPAQLLVFDLSTDWLINRIKISTEYSQNANSKGLLITPVVETHGFGCQHTIVYMADVDGYGMVIYNGRELKRLSDPSFAADQNYMNFTIAGESFQLPDGLFSLALQPRTHASNSGRLFYRPLASVNQYFVSTRSLARAFDDYDKPNYKIIDYTFPSQVTIQTFSRSGVLFMGYTNPPAIACWNSYKPMNEENVVIVAQDDETLQFTSGMKIKGNALWATTNRFQKIMTGTQDFTEVNFRILHEPNINDLIRSNKCRPPVTFD